MKSIYFLLLLTVYSNLLFTQTIRQEPYFSHSDSKTKQAEIERIAVSVNKYLSPPSSFNKDALKLFSEETNRIRLNFANTINKDAIFDDLLWSYTKNTHEKIIKANPNLLPTRVYVATRSIPNALSVGEGSIIINTGLLSELENEDQLAFVICHEIAHFVLQHSKKQLIREIQRLESKSFKEEVKKAQSSKYNQFENLESLYKNTLFNARYHNRTFERQADSLAFHLYANTPFASTEPQRLMQLFQTIDEPVNDSSLYLNLHFGCKNYPFKKSWMEDEKSSTWGSAVMAKKSAQKQLVDSLKTHPDAQLRLSWLKLMKQQYPSSVRNDKKSTSSYQQIRYVSALENTDAAFREEQYDLTTYLSLLYQDLYRDSSYFKEIFALTINQLYHHSKDHTLNKVLSQTSPYYSDRYNELLHLLNNLSLSDLLELQSCAISQTKTDSQYGLYAHYCYEKGIGNLDQASKLKNSYFNKYPSGRFISALKSDK